MHSPFLNSPPHLASSSSSFIVSSLYANTTRITLKPRKKIPRIPPSISLKCAQTLDSKSYVNKSPIFSLSVTDIPIQFANVTQKLDCLVQEFKSLTEPIERVKRLLNYATLLPFFDESARSPENRVTGCTAQVWLEVTMNLEGSMRFRVDSDSEITKGFCSCLIWLLDGAAPEDVLEVKAEDLAEMNVGILPANSRVNTWHTVLTSMQKRTKSLAAARFIEPPLEPFPCLVSATNDISARESSDEAKGTDGIQNMIVV